MGGILYDAQVVWWLDKLMDWYMDGLLGLGMDGW